MMKEITLQDLANMITAQNLRFDAIDERFDTVNNHFVAIDNHFKQFDSSLDDLKIDTSEIRLEQTKLSKLQEQTFSRVLGIESDVKEIYDRLVILEGV